MTADVSQDRRVTVLNRGHKRPVLTEGSRLCWALPSPVHERSGYRAWRPTGYKVMRSFRSVAHGPVLASRLACHRDTTARCGRTIIAPSSSRSRPLTRRLRRWPSASLDRASPRRQRAPPTNDALLTTYSPYKVQPIIPWAQTVVATSIFFTPVSSSSSASAGVSQCLSRSGVESRSDCGYLIRVIDAQIGALREVLSQQPVGVLVRAALPGTSWIAEVDLDARIDLETI